MYAVVETPIGREQQVASAACVACVVRTTCICGSLHDEDLPELDRLAQYRCYPARYTLFSEGEESEYVFNIRKGVVRLSMFLSDGRRQILGFVLPGDFLGLYLKERYSFTAETIGEAEVCRFERRPFVDYLDAKPRLLRSLHTATASELALGREQIMLLGRRTAEEKIATFLLGLRARYKRVSPCDLTLPLPMTRQDIADYCGLTQETVSRVFSKLAREKAILSVPEGVRFIMLDRLRALAA